MGGQRSALIRLRFGGPSFRLVSLILAYVAVMIGQSSSVPVTLAPATSPGDGQPGVTLLNVTGVGFPSGSIDPSQVTITLTPVNGGTGPSISSAANVVSLLGSTRRITFQIPAATSITPNFSVTNKRVTVFIVAPGAKFVRGATTANFGPDISVDGAAPGAFGVVDVKSATSAVAVLAVGAKASIGSRSVALRVGTHQGVLKDRFLVISTSKQPIFQTTGISVTSPVPYLVSLSGTTATGTAFASTNSATLTVEPAAQIASISPQSGTPGQSLNVTIVGQYTNFVQGSTQANFGPGVSVNGSPLGTSGFVTVVNQTTAMAQLAIDPKAAAATQTVTVNTGIQQASLPNGFTIQGAQPAISVNPNTGQQGQQNIPVAIAGQNTHFVQGTSQASFGTGITVVSLTVASPTSATAVLNIDPAAPAGSNAVTMTTSNEVVSLASGFTVLSATPVLLSVDPNAGQQGQQNLSITITGQNTHFVQGTSNASFGAGVTVTNLSVTDATHGTAMVAIAANATPGAHDVVVTTGSENVTLRGGFTITVTGALLYCANGISNNITVYQVDPSSGSLTQIPASPFAAGQLPHGITIDPSNRFLYVTNADDSDVSAYTLNPADGTLKPIIGTPFAAGISPHAVVVEPSGRFAYVENAGSNNLSAYSIDQQIGTLSSISGSPFPAGPDPLFNLAVHPSGKFLYVPDANENQPGDISAYSIDSVSGALTALAGSPYSVGVNTDWIAIDPSGRFVYVGQGSQAGTAVYGFSIDPNSGALTPLPSSPFLIGDITRAMAIDPTGRFLFIANDGSNTVSVLAINQGTGALSSLAGSPYAVGGTPASIILDPSGNFLYVANAGDGTLSGFELNQTTGTLTPVPGSPFSSGAEPLSLAVVQLPPSNPPVLISVSPNGGQQGQSLNLTMLARGTHFAQGVSQLDLGAGITASNIAVGCSSCLSAQIAIANDASIGVRNVTITTGSEIVSLAGGFSVQAGASLVSISPNSGQQGQQNLLLTVTGQNTHFVQGSTLANFGPGITVVSLAVTSPTSATAIINISPTAPPTSNTVTMATGSEVAALANGFTVEGAQPAIASVNPNIGQQGQQNLSVVITGQNTNFIQGTSIASFGAGITVVSLTVNSSTSATAAVNIDPAALIGSRAVTITTGSEIVTLANGFTIGGPLVITSLPPATRNWVKQSPGGPLPGPRAEGASPNSYDAANDRLMIFSGQQPARGEPGGNVDPPDVWVLNNATGTLGVPSWTQLSPINAGPAGRWEHAFAYSQASNRLIVQGGGTSWEGSTGFADTWALTNANGEGGSPQWIRLPDIPSMRSDPGTAVDESSGSLIMFGGLFPSNVDTNEVWVLTHADGNGAPAWVQLAPAGPLPPIREHFPVAFDQENNRLIVFGGRVRQGLSVNYLNDLWVLTNANGETGIPQWVQLTPTGSGPPPSCCGTLAYDPATNEATLFGGYQSSTNNELWVLSNANGLGGVPQWSKIATNGGPPYPRDEHVAAYSASSHRMAVAFGIVGSTGVLVDDLWLLTEPAPSVVEGQTFSYAVRAKGPISTDPLTFSLDVAPAGMTVDGSTGLIQWSPDPTQTNASYSVVVRVRDVFNATATQSFSITAFKLNQAPVLDAGGSFSVILPNTLSMEPSVYDDGLPAGSVLAGTWSQVSGPGTITFSDPTALNAVPTFSAPGTYVLRLTESDSELSASDEVVVTANAVNQPPVVYAGPDQIITLPANAILSGTVSDENVATGGPLSFAWSTVSGPGTVTFVNGSGPPLLVTATFSAPGVYVLRLSASDGSLTGTSDLTVTVNPAQTAVVQSVIPNTGQLGQQNLVVTISGLNTHFAQGTTQLDLGAGVAVGSVVVSSATNLTAQISIDANAVVGPRTVTVTTGSEIASLPGGFIVTASLATVPNLLTLTPPLANAAIGMANLTVGAVTRLDQPLTLDFTQLPSAQGFTYTLIEHSAPESSVFSVSGGTLTQNTIGVGGCGAGGIFYQWNGSVDTKTPFTLTARARVLQDAGQALVAYGLSYPEIIYNPFGFGFYIGTGTETFGLGIGKSSISGVDGNFTLSIDNSVFHDYRLDAQPGIGYQIYVDGNLVLTGNPLSVAGGNGNLLAFGQLTCGVQAHAEMTSFSFQQSPGFVTAQAPSAGAEVLPLSSVNYTALYRPHGRPVVTAGADQEVALTAGAILMGIVTDDGLAGPLVSVAWSQVAGPAPVTFSPANAAQSSASFSAPGIYVLRLTAADAEFSNSADVTITVDPSSGTPQLISVVPNVATRGITLNTTITGLNTHFLQGATQAAFDPGITVNTVQVVSPTQLSVNLSVDNAALLGGRTLVVTTGSEVVGLRNAFVVDGPYTPYVMPISGLPGQTLTVVFAVDCLTPLVQANLGVSFGSGISVNSVSVIDGNGVSVNLTIASNAVIGFRDITVTVGTETVVTRNGFTVLPPQTAPALSSVSPSSGGQGSTTLVTITGQNTHFAQGTSVVSFGPDLSVSGVSVLNATSLTANVTIPPGESLGAVTVSVTTGGEVASLANGFAVTPVSTIPTITTVSPNSGPQGLGGPVGIVGQNTHFVQGTTQVDFGSGITVSNISVSCPMCLTAQLQIAANATPGPRTITITTGSEVVSLVNGFTVVSNGGGAFLTSLTPAGGQQGQSLSVAVTGQNTNFAQGTTLVDFGPGVAVSNILVSSATSLTAQLAIDPNAAVGPRTLTVTTGSEVVSAQNVFNVLQATPTLYSLNPGGGQQGAQGLSVAITGLNTHFVQGTSVATFGNGVTVVSLTIASATSATAVVNIDPGAPLVLNTVTITTGSEVASFPNGFSIVAAGSGPIILNLDPGGSSQGAFDLPVSITGLGTHFAPGTSVASFGAGITVSSLSVTSATTATALVNIDPAAALGPRTVTVTTGSEVASFASGFTVVAGVAGITSINPGGGPQGAQNLSLAVTAQFTHFVQGTTTATFGAGVTLISLSISSSTTATAVVSVDPAATVGPRDVTFTTGAEVVTAPGGFTVTQVVAAISAVSPNSGQLGQQGITVTVAGQNTHFAPGTSQVSFGAGITVGTVTVSSATSLTAQISIAGSATPGPQNVTITTGTEVATLANGFRILAGTPILAAVSPNIGQQGQQGLPVTITGQFTNFVQGISQVSFGGGITVGSATVLNATSLTAIINIAASAPLGPAPVTVTTGNEVATLANAFTVQAPAGPISVNPSSGVQAQNLSVTITAQSGQFVQGVTVARFGPGVMVGTGIAGDFGPVTVTSATTATAQLTILAAALPASRTVTIQTGNVSILGTNAFQILGAPFLSNISPNLAAQAQTITVNVTGSYTNFVQGATQMNFGAGISVSGGPEGGFGPVAVNSATSATAQITIDAAAALGLRPVSAQTGGELAIVATGFSVLGPVIGPGPLVTITSPADTSDVTAPTTVTGTVTTPNLDYWTLEYQAPTATSFVQFATGTSSQASGSFDPTLLLNGNAVIRLTGVDTSGQTTSTTITVVLTRNLKIGNFTVSFNDLSVPVAGLPIQVVRTYDSRFKGNGDFGVGWRLDLNTVQITESIPLGSQWTESSSGGPFPTYCLQETQTHKMTVTLADGTTYEFVPSLNPNCQQLNPIENTQVAITFAPTGITPPNAALSIAGNNQPYVIGSVPGPVTLTDLDNLTTFDPDQYQLTLPDGRVLLLSQKLGLQMMTDLNGNTLTVTPNGITSSTGKSVTFVRDTLNRIQTITDPNNNQLQYGYDASGDLISFTDPANNVSTYTYDSNHDLLTIVDPSKAQPIRNDYDANGRLVSHTDAYGNVINYTNDPNTSQETITDRLGNLTVNEYDSAGNIVKITDALGGVTARTYDGNGNVKSETNALGKTTSYTYDANNNRTMQTDPLGNVTSYLYNNRNQVTMTTDPLKHVTLNVYDDSTGNLKSTQDGAGYLTSYTYDAQGNRTSMTDPLQHVTNYTYDPFGNQKTVQDPLGQVTGYLYDNNGNRTQQSTTRTTPSGTQTLITGYQYDSLNRLIETDYPDVSNTTIQYNSIGKQSLTTDQLGRQTAYQYDLMGRLTLTTYPDQTTETASYDANGNRIASTDRDGRQTIYTYDPLNRLTRTTYADSSFTTTGYDSIGEMTAVTDALNNITQYAYDDAGRRTQVTDALGHITLFQYDGAGNQISMTDANGNTTQYQYDGDNRRTTVIYPDQTTDQTAYDGLGRTIGKTDQAGLTTQFTYDADGRLTRVTDALNQVTGYAYDEVGNRISQTDANTHTTTFAYDQLGRRTQRALPLGMSENSTYDAAGNLKTKTDFSGKITTYGYDPNNNWLTSKTPDPTLSQPTVTFTYTSTGRRQSMTDASGTATYSYDLRDRLLQKAAPEGTLVYTYDSNGNLKTIRSSNAGGTSVNYFYDPLNRLSQVTDNRLAAGTTTYSYDNAGNLSGYVYPNSAQTAFAYDTLNRLTNLTIGTGAGSLASYAYKLGPAGNRTQVTELSGRQVNYGYDSLYRLTGETISNDPTTANNGAIGYQYDPVGNRLQRTSTVAPVPAAGSTYDANDRLTSDTYDNDGNTIASGGKTYLYDYENHLTSENAGEAMIVYDGDGNRVSKTTGGTTTQYLVDDRNLTGYAQVLEEVSGGAVQRVYTYGLNRISQSQASGTSFYGYDGHGNVRLLTDATGAVTDRYDYDAFGNIISQAGSTPNVYLYSGEQNDPNLGLYYLRARYLSQSRGRFWTMDPYEGDVNDPLRLHKYLYASNDPVNGTDPTGKAVFVATRPLNDPVGGFFRNVADHVFLVFTSGGVTDQAAWASLVSNKNGLQYPWNGSGPITFSFHPTQVCGGPSQNQLWLFATSGSCIAYNDPVDLDALTKSGSGYARYQIQTDDATQFQLFDRAILSRNNINSGLGGPNYCAAAFNCGSWVLTMLSGLQVPPAVNQINGGVGNEFKLQFTATPRQYANDISYTAEIQFSIMFNF